MWRDSNVLGLMLPKPKTAVLISPDDLESLEETLELRSDANAVRDLVEAEVAVASGDVVRGIDAVRALRRARTR